MSSGEQLTVSEQLQWIKDGVPRKLYEMLETRMASVFRGAVSELKEFVDSAPNSRHGLAASACDVCGGLLDKPMRAPSCAHVACEACVLRSGVHCGKCGARAPAASWQFDSKRRAQVFALKTHCPLGDCEWLGKRSALQPHVEEDCDFTPMPCLYPGCDACLVRCVYLLHLKGCKFKPRGAKVPDDAPARRDTTTSNNNNNSAAAAAPSSSTSSTASSASAAASASSSSSSSEKQRRKEKREQRRKEKKERKVKSPRHHRSSSAEHKEAKHTADAAAALPAPSSPSSSPSLLTTSAPAPVPTSSASVPVIAADYQQSPLSATDLAAAAAAAGVDLSQAPEEERVMTAAEARLAAMSQPRVREDNHHKALRNAAFSGDTEELTKLLADPQTDVNSRDKNGMSLMVSACVNGRLAACRALLRAGADASLNSATGNGPLHYLCKWKPGATGGSSATPSSVPTSPRGGASAPEAAGLGKVARPAGVMSSTRQYQRLLTKLIENGASIAANDQGETPLHVACRSANIAAAITLLTTTEIDVNQKSTAFSYTPLHLAAKSGDLEMIKLLLKHGGDPLLRAQNFAKRSMIHGLHTTGSGAGDRQRNTPLTPLDIAKRNQGASDELCQLLKQAEIERIAAMPAGGGDAGENGEGPTTPRGMVGPTGRAGSVVSASTLTLPDTGALKKSVSVPITAVPSSHDTAAATAAAAKSAATAAAAAAAAAAANTTATAAPSQPGERPTGATESLMAEKKRASGQWGSLRSGAVAQMATLSKEEIAELMAAIQKADGVVDESDGKLTKANSDDEASDSSSSSESAPLPPPPDDDAAAASPAVAPAAVVVVVAEPAGETLPVMKPDMLRASKLVQTPGKVQISNQTKGSNRWAMTKAEESDEDAENNNLSTSDDAMRRKQSRQSRKRDKLRQSDSATVEDKS